MTKQGVIKALGKHPAAKALAKVTIGDELDTTDETASAWLISSFNWCDTPPGTEFWRATYQLLKGKGL